MDEHQQEIKSPHAQDMLRAAGLPPDVCHGEGEVLVGALRTSRQLGGVVEVATWCRQQQSCAGPAAPRSRICSFPGHFTSASLTVSSSNGNDFYLGWNLMMKKKNTPKSKKNTETITVRNVSLFHFFFPPKATTNPLLYSLLKHLYSETMLQLSSVILSIMCKSFAA